MSRKLYFIMLMLAVSLGISAQKLTIDGGLKETNEETDSQYPRKDANNKPCALLKVEVVDAITKVEGGVVGNVVDNGTEKWIYFEGGQKTFRLHFANHLPVTINYNEGLKANNTYILLLTDSSASSSTVADADKQGIRKQKPSSLSKEAEVYESVDKMPQYPGGPSALFEFLSKNIRYPIDAEKKGVQGRVVVSFIVEKDGAITIDKILKSVSPSLDNEAIRVIKSMPTWKPGKNKRKKVRVKYSVPVTFRLR